jgi:plasmid stabilization system protein ParE
LTVPAASETFSFVFAMLGESFRSVARAVFPLSNARKLAPLVLAVAIAGCGGSSAPKPTAGKRVAAAGYRFTAPAGWQVTRTPTSVAAKQGAAIVSVTTFRLARRFRPALWPEVVTELDRVAAQLAGRVHGKVRSAATRRIAGRRARVYEIVRGGEDERIAFVLNGRREYQLYCRGAGSACNTLLASFTLVA